MFFQKVMIGAVGGGILGIVIAVIALLQGEAFREVPPIVLVGIVIGVIVVFWATKDVHLNVDDRRTDPEIAKLQNRLRDTLDAAAFYETNGERAKAALRRSDAAVIEAKLRNLGS